MNAALAELVATGKNIVYDRGSSRAQLPGVNQGQTNDKAGFTFAKGLRAYSGRILTSSWSVRCVTPKRSRTAIEASLTGHPVLSHPAHEQRRGERREASSRWASSVICSPPASSELSPSGWCCKICRTCRTQIADFSGAAGDVP